MKKITAKMVNMLVENKKERFVIIVNHCFYYIEKGHIYRFQQHNNTKMLTVLGSFYDGEIENEQMITALQKSIIDQMQYDWFTDVWKETFFERINRSSSDFDAFFF